MDSIFGIHEQALAVRRQRQDLIANNLANADTPNFKARDLEWRKEMQAAEESMSQSINRPDMKTTHSRHISGFAEAASTESYLKYRQPTQPALDGNTVETHIEKAQFMENAMQYQATLEFLNGKINGIRGALKGE